MRGNQLILMIDDGGRLEKPFMCPPLVYEVMLNCWKRLYVYNAEYRHRRRLGGKVRYGEDYTPSTPGLKSESSIFSCRPIDHNIRHNGEHDRPTPC